MWKLSGRVRRPVVRRAARPSALALVALAFLPLVIAAPSAEANMAAPPPPAKVSGIGSASGPTPIEVRDAALVIDCSRGPDACRLEVTYQLHNGGTAQAGGVAAFYAIDTQAVAVTVDGTPADHPLTGGDAEAFDATFAAGSDDASGDLGRYGDRVTRHGVALSLAAGAAAQVVVSGTIHPTSRNRYYLGLPAAPARHRLLVRGGRSDRRVKLDYLVAPIRTWSGFPGAMSFTLIHPAAWDADVSGVEDATAVTAGGLTTRRGRIAPATTSSISMELSLSAATPLHAGLLLGVGGQVDDADGLRLRAGVEAGRGSYLASFAVELEREAGDSDGGVVLVPAFTAASPWIIILPSVGLGLGVPIRVSPTLEIGGRFQADAHLGPVGFLMALDYYPGMDADPRRFSVSLFGQLAL